MNKLNHHHKPCARPNHLSDKLRPQPPTMIHKPSSAEKKWSHYHKPRAKPKYLSDKLKLQLPTQKPKTESRWEHIKRNRQTSNIQNTSITRPNRSSKLPPLYMQNASLCSAASVSTLAFFTTTGPIAMIDDTNKSL